MPCYPLVAIFYIIRIVTTLDIIKYFKQIKSEITPYVRTYLWVTEKVLCTEWYLFSIERYIFYQFSWIMQVVDTDPGFLIWSAAVLWSRTNKVQIHCNSCCASMNENRTFQREKTRSALYLIYKCLEQIKKQCANFSELPSNISTMLKSNFSFNMQWPKLKY